MLEGYPVEISVYIILSVAAELDALLAVEALIARRDVDGQILRRVLVIHIEGDVEIDAAHQIDGLFHGVQIHHGAAVGVEAAEAAHHLPQALETVVSGILRHGVGAVDLADLPGSVYISVSRNADEIDAARIGVHAADHDRVGIAADLVHAGEDQRVHAFSALRRRALPRFRHERSRGPLSRRRGVFGRGALRRGGLRARQGAVQQERGRPREQEQADRSDELAFFTSYVHVCSP